MSDPLVRRHDPAAPPPAGAPDPAPRPAGANGAAAEAQSADDAVKVVTLAQLLAAESAEAVAPPAPTPDAPADAEYGGPKGLEPTRYGDWEKGGRCIDF